MAIENEKYDRTHQKLVHVTTSAIYETETDTSHLEKRLNMEAAVYCFRR